MASRCVCTATSRVSYRMTSIYHKFTATVSIWLRSYTCEPDDDWG